MPSTGGSRDDPEGVGRDSFESSSKRDNSRADRSRVRGGVSHPESVDRSRTRTTDRQTDDNDLFERIANFFTPNVSMPTGDDPGILGTFFTGTTGISPGSINTIAEFIGRGIEQSLSAMGIQGSAPAHARPSLAREDFQRDNINQVSSVNQSGMGFSPISVANPATDPIFLSLLGGAAFGELIKNVTNELGQQSILSDKQETSKKNTTTAGTEKQTPTQKAKGPLAQKSEVEDQVTGNSIFSQILNNIISSNEQPRE